MIITTKDGTIDVIQASPRLEGSLLLTGDRQFLTKIKADIPQHETGKIMAVPGGSFEHRMMVRRQAFLFWADRRILEVDYASIEAMKS